MKKSSANAELFFIFKASTNMFVRQIRFVGLPKRIFIQNSKNVRFSIFEKAFHKINLSTMKKISKLLTILFVFVLTLSTVSVCVVSADSCGFTLSEKVYLGGFPIGLSTLGEGLYVDDFAVISTENGAVSPLKNKGIAKGDILLSVNGKAVSSRIDVQNSILPNATNRLVFLNNEKKFVVECYPAYDKKTNSYLLGLYLSDGINGIGTVTFVRQDGRFSALGHPVTDMNGQIAKSYDGKIFKCVVDGVTPSRANNPGRLNGDFFGNEQIGKITEITEYGVYGNMTSSDYKNTEIQTGQRLGVTTGNAKIYTTLKGETPDYYDVEIIALSFQTKIKEKGILLKATDKRLLAIGGIVQGMSGSPIIQNNKLVGAVTHVLVDDTTKGYGIYSDFLIETSDKR